MSESIAAPYEGRLDESQNGAGEGHATTTSGAVLFPELVSMHYRWQRQVGHVPERARDAKHGATTGGQAQDGDHRAARSSERAFRAKLDEFEAAEGKIVEAYWCWTEASAVVLTERERRRAGKRRDPELRLHRATDWATIEAPEVAELLHHYDALAIKAGEILTPAPKRIAMERIFAEQSYLLGYVETKRASPSATRESVSAEMPPVAQDPRPEPARPSARKPTTDLGDLVGRQRAMLKQVEAYYDRAGNNAARIYYFCGMAIGMLLLLLAAALVVVPLILWGGIAPNAMRDYLATYVAGALGACVSVMSRMRQEDGFKVDYEVGRMPLFVLGGVRPAIGAIFGTATYFALQSSLIQTAPQAPNKAFYFFALLAFLSGFSERFTHVIFGQAEKTVTSTIEAEEKREAAIGAEAARTETTN